MKIFLNLEPDRHDGLMTHLLPPGEEREQAAFLFVQEANIDGQIGFEVLDTHLIDRAEFAAQHSDYLELSNAARIRLIKKAHTLSSSIVELHSHPGPWPAAFSLSDRAGLKETVPHMWWRLKGRPYLAIVVAPSGFDALVWLDNPRVPRALDGLVVGTTVLRPTNNSLGGWQ